jgi:LPS sulfotransferase NodH
MDLADKVRWRLEAGLWNLRRAAVRYGLTPARRDFTPFIILGRGRSGSNFLASLLRSHPQVCCFGEVFHNDRHDTIFWDTPGYRVRPQDVDLRERDPIAFLDREVFGPVPKSIRAVGFKLFYYHAREEHWRILWSELQARKQCRILHLHRRNELRAILSEKLAERTQLWFIYEDKDAHTGLSVSISRRELELGVADTREYETRYRKMFADHPQLDVDYEDLAADTQGEAARILEFLGVAPRAVTAVTRKQNRQPMAKAITNYAALKAECAGTNLAAYFDE